MVRGIATAVMATRMVTIVTRAANDMSALQLKHPRDPDFQSYVDRISCKIGARRGERGSPRRAILGRRDDRNGHGHEHQTPNQRAFSFMSAYARMASSRMVRRTTPLV